MPASRTSSASPSIPLQVFACTLALALTACGQSAPADSTANDRAAPTPQPSRTDAVAAETDAAEAYYARLLSAHAADYAACGPSVSHAADACTEGASAQRTPAAPARRVLLMLDASGSMAARMAGDTKLKIAQDALLDFAARVPAEAQVGLRVYGHRGRNDEAGKAVSCAGTDLLHAFGPRDASRLASAVRSFQPRGWTPIGASLQAAAADFQQAGATADGNVIYLVSDGIETCGGDPAAAARALHASDVRVVVNVIGFDVDAAAERQLRDVARAGGGEYVAASDREMLRHALNTRFADALRLHTCTFSRELRASNATFADQLKRKNCLSGKALQEKNAVTGAALRDRNADRITAAVRAHVDAKATDKYDAITSGSDAEYARVTSASDARYDARTRASDARYRETREAVDAERATPHAPR